MTFITSYPRGPLLVVSPHLNDGVFSCGELIAAFPGALVATVFTSTPVDHRVLTNWDQQCGFNSAYEAMRTRRAENAAALEVLGAAPLWLGFCETQYTSSPTVMQIATELDRLLFTLQPNVVAIPLGLFKPENYLVHAACIAVRKNHPQPLWVAYEEVPQRLIEGVLQQRLAEFQAHNIVAAPVFFETGTQDSRVKYAERTQRAALKHRAIEPYKSLLRVFSLYECADIEAPERYWQLRNLGEMGANCK